ncbi:MAG: squalene--hopene cyclase [Blastocatellia bacterium]|nr:squalene--hopene cyclase [Blastocatellia bacterium]
MSFAQAMLATEKEAVKKTLDQAVEYMLSIQHPDGYWWAELEANVTLTAEYVMLHRILGTEAGRPLHKVAKYFLDHQREHGGWELFWGDGGELSTTVEAYFALKMLGYSPDHPSMQAARKFVLARGGITKCRIFTKLHLALFGAYPWEGIPALPPWIMELPEWFPFTIYEMASWARSSTVPLLIVCDKKPVWAQDGLNVDELYVGGRENADFSLPKDDGIFTIGNIFVGLDKVFKLADKMGLVPFKEKSLKHAETWVLEHQDEPGDWAGIIPAMLNSLLAFHSLGYPTTHDVVVRGLSAIDRFGIETEDSFHIQPCVSPVWDTGLMVIGLRDAGLPADHPALVKAGEWLISKQIHRKGDWAIKNKTGQPGGWAFEFYNDFYPDVDDTAVIIMALHRVKLPDEKKRLESIRIATEWVLSMQCKKGGWAAFDVDNDLDLLNQIPYGDLKAMIDPCTADLTGRVLEMLGRTGYKADKAVIDRAIAFLHKEIEPEGCWFGRWGVNYIYGTSGVINGLVHIGVDPREAYVMSAIQWLYAHQNEDGGWGETCDSYKDRTLMGEGVSTASQTAWALLGLIAGGEGHSDAVRRGVEYLVKTQQSEGNWNEAEFTGTGFPCHFYINYHYYRYYFPLMALGRYYHQTR